jgi:hypothetical protein
MEKTEIKPDWRLVRVEYTEHCNAEWIKKKGITALGMIYLADANLHVHICSLTPCLEAWPVQSFVDFKSFEFAELDGGEAEIEVFRDEEPVSYFDLTVLKNSISASNYAPTRDDDETFDDYRMRAADEVRDHLAGNPIDFETLKRREAKNV